MTHDEQNNSSDTGTKVPMTHDELLISVNMNAQTTGGLEQNTNALRAVVELARPVETYGTLTLTGYNKAMSKVIQAIENELK